MRKNLQIKAWILLILFISEIFSPVHLMALGSGPSQPEMASFTPAGTTELVDPFTGDFSYNIPLMDVEGYPINIAYNSGITMEQEASWVGLGWNLNVGAITRSVRGLPDDFKGEEITKEVSMKPMRIIKMGATKSAELLGEEFLKVNANYGISFIHNNYKGFGLALDGSVGVSAGGAGDDKENPKNYPALNGDLGLNINSLDGTSINQSLSMTASGLGNKHGSFSFGANLGSGYNTRTGQTILSHGTSAGFNPRLKNARAYQDNGEKKYTNQVTANGPSTSFSSSMLPIGMETYTPYSSTKMKSITVAFSGAFGGEAAAIHPNFNVDGSITIQEVDKKNDNTRAYGYLYTEESDSESLKDYNNDRTVALNKHTKNLSPVNFTYDVYSVSGQGVSGMFRPFRNDIGVLHQPAYKMESGKSLSFGAELGLGGVFRAGASVTDVKNEVKHGPWIAGNANSDLKFEGDQLGSIYEKVYFKAAGDKAQVDLDYLDKVGGTEAIAFNLSHNDARSDLKTSNGGSLYSLPSNHKDSRISRSKVFSFLTAEEASYAGLCQISSYHGEFYKGSLNDVSVSRIDGNKKGYHLSEITQINPNGERFVFGIPVYNLSKEEVVYTTHFNTPNGTSEYATEEGLIHHTEEEDDDEVSSNNESGIDGYYSSTTTPAYAHSYLLTGKTSADYQDVTGNGITPDDIGTAHKFNYTQTNTAYQWRAPYEGSTFLKGYETNILDQKGSFSYGVKEMWYLHSVESKNQIVEFRISPREDALGAKDRLYGGKPDENGDPIFLAEQFSYRLDQIVLYDKLDRLKNKEQAVPIKTIDFTYDYSLCPGVKNQRDRGAQDEGGGKLTLKKIEISYGNSDQGKESPYDFEYSTENPSYNANNVDRWGNYKKRSFNPGNTENNHFPYTLQENYSDLKDMDSLSNAWANAWNLTKIELPTGGEIDVTYEADDYGYVQHKDAMQMFPVVGAGNTTTYQEVDKLYGNEFLYIKRPKNVPTGLDQDRLRELFLGKEKTISNMYFKFLADIDEGADNFEYASGYSSALDIGYCNGNDDYLFISIPGGSPNSISKMIWSVFRLNLYEVLYDQPNVKDTGLESVLKGFVANVGDILSLFTNIEEQLERRKIAHKFKLHRSFVRLNNPLKFKKGGGSRVRSVVMNDGWQNMSGQGENSTYGQYYEYTTLDENQDTISSGVASYEPMIGNDENPFREPVRYVAQQSQGNIPAIDAFQEAPFGESFFPSATVGYSKVTVRNIHDSRGETSKAVTEHEFSTAKDFPVEVSYTPIDVKDSPAKKGAFSFPFVNNSKHSIYTASQGYAIVLNDMHGKPKSTTNYLVVEEEGVSVRKKLGGTNYTYHTKTTTNGLALDNEVEVLTPDGYIKKQLLGVEYDLAIESRRSYELMTTNSYQGNLDVISIAPVPPLVVTAVRGIRNNLSDKKETRTLVTTKVIQTYGIIKSVETFTDQYSTTAHNKLFDGTTGEVLLTESTDEHLASEFNYAVPARTLVGQERMGGAYENLRYRDYFQKSSDTTCNKDGKAFTNPGYLKHGDELLVYKNGNPIPTKAWVNIPYEAPPSEDCNNSPFQVRLFTGWSDAYQGVCADTAIKQSQTYLKGHHGKLLNDVEIYHLKENYAEKINSITYDDFIAYDGEVISVDTSIARFLIPLSYYNSEHSQFCQEFDMFNGDTTIFSSGLDLNYNLKDLSKYHVTDLFDLTDPISGALDMSTTIELNNQKSLRHAGSFSRVDGIASGVHVSYDKCFAPEEANNALSTKELGFTYSHLYNDPDRRYSIHRSANPARASVGHMILEDFYAPYSYTYFVPATKGTFHSGSTKRSTRNWQNLGSHIAEVEELNKGVEVNSRIKPSVSSQSWIRLDYNRNTDIHLEKYLDKIQLYLVRYFAVQEDGSIDTLYYIEKGISQKAFLEQESGKKLLGYRYSQYNSTGRFLGNNIYQNLFEFCNYTKPPYNLEAVNFEERLKYCYDNYNLLTHAGDTLTDYNSSDYYLVVRSGNDNQLSVQSGQVSTLNYPLKVDQSQDTGRFLGIKEVVDGLELTNASNANFREKHQLQLNYVNSGNKFLNGSEGHYKQDSVLTYVSSRAQGESSVETRKEGYMDVLPELWQKGTCVESYFPPKWNSSSGWFLNSQITKYSDMGLGVEAKNNLDIYSTSITNYKGGVELVASNTEQHNIAYDNFEDYEVLGVDGTFPESPFHLIDLTDLGTASEEGLLSVGGVDYEYRSYPNEKRLVEGIAHSGNKSLFLKGNGSGTVNVTYEEQSQVSLSQQLLSEEIADATIPIPIPYTTTATHHFDRFTANFSTELSDRISDLKTNGVNEVSMQLPVGGSNGVFQPDSGRFLVSIWAKELVASGTPYQGASPYLEVTVGNTVKRIAASGPIIDGWQKIEAYVEYDDIQSLEIKLSGGLWGCFFDDFRMHPFESNVNTYVYDPFSNRLTGKLDENNYATFYEYDEEGIPSQLKRETDQGILTVSESRQSIHKKQ